MKPSTFNLQSFGSKDLVQTPADSKVNAKAVITLAGRRMRCIQCLNLLRCQRQWERHGVLLYMGHKTGFGNSNHVTATNGPGQRNTSRRATVCCANTRKRGIAQAVNIRVRFEDWPLACLAWTQCGLAKCELSLARKRASHVVTPGSDQDHTQVN